jgi:polyisoprenoid-binding protein YceI
MSGKNSHREGKARKSVPEAVIAAGWTALLSVFLAAAPANAGAPGVDQTFSLDQRFSSIEFSVRNLFQTRLVLNNSHPERTKISVAVDAGSVDMSWHEAADMLRSADFFDVQRYPEVRYQSSSVQELTRGHFTIRGLIQIRGITQPLTLHAVLTKQSQDPADHSQIDDFVVHASLRRSAFGMTADRGFISDNVNIVIKARLKLPQTFNAE